MNAFQESGPRGVETRPPQLFSLAFAVGVICFPGGSNPHNPPPIFTLVNYDHFFELDTNGS